MKKLILSNIILPALVLGTHAADKPASVDKPNILVILADDLRADCMGAVNPLIHTPNIDRLAKRGVLFKNCYIAGANGAGVCQPSRVQLLAGCSPFHLPADNAAPGTPVEKPSAPVMPTVFQQAGYETFFCGKSGNTYQRAQMAFQERVFINLTAGVKHDWDAEVAKRRQYADEVISYLDRASRTRKPFFVLKAPSPPHDPLYCDRGDLKLYQGENLPPLPATAAVDHKAFAGFNLRDTNVRVFDVPGIGSFKPPLDLTKWRGIIGQYYAMVTTFDRHIGRILDELERTGALENTIIVFTSDNGHSFSDHGLIHKASLYEHDIKVPLIVCGPGIPQGRRSDAFVYLSNLFPTLCELTGTPIPDTVQTKSFRANLLDPSAPGRPDLTFAYTEEMRGFRDERFKIILYSNHVAQLFDLKNDPWELHDLAKDPSQARRLASMIDQLRAANKADGDFAGKRVANLYRPWPQTAGRLEKDGKMLWEVWEGGDPHD